MIMNYEILPGPSLAELARTALARAAAATVSEASQGNARQDVAGRVPVRTRPDGSPLLLAATGSMLEQRLTTCPDAVTVSVPAAVPFSSLRLTGTARAVARDMAARITACAVALRSVEFGGAVPAEVPVEAFHAAAPDPLWRVAPGILEHLENGHMAELTGCVRAHGLVEADWVIPRGLDRHGLELLVLTPDGTVAVRLSFPDGPVSSLEEVPASIRTVLTCRCRSGPGHEYRRRQTRRTAGE
jgi:hypothetical protein